MKIQRSELIAFIEQACDKAGVPDFERAKLLEVAYTSKFVARGSCDFYGCGCPAVQAGLWRVFAVPARTISEFALWFDRITAPSFKSSAAVIERLEVVE